MKRLLEKLPLLPVLIAVMIAAGCGPILRTHQFNEAKEYFVATPLTEHTPGKGAKASWHLIKDPEASAPMLLDKLTDEDPVNRGVGIILLQATGGQKYREQLVEALNSYDWSNAPGHMESYISMVKDDIQAGRKGVVEE